MNSSDFKALIVVLAIGGAIFWLARPVAHRFGSDADFSRRRNVWLLLTAVGFLSPNIWLYALVAAPLYWWAARKDTNPMGFYLLMLHVVPPVLVIIPVVGNNGLFPLDNYRLLSLFFLAPLAWRLKKASDKPHRSNSSAMDVMLLVFGVLVVALYTAPDLPNHSYIPDSFTNALRRAFLFFLDVYLLYWVVKRSCTSRRAIADALAAFCLAITIMAAIATFEVARHWLLYVDIVTRWGGNPKLAMYLTHAGILRAEASSGHALSLGYLLAVAFAFWLYLKTQVPSRTTRVSVVLILWMGLLASYSRGPWLGAAAGFFVFNAAGPRPLSRAARAVGIACLIAICVAISPLGPQIVHAFSTTGPSGTVDPDLVYRERIAERGWQLVMAHPLFGDHFPWPAMADLRQGEGIIDIVNTYLGVALNYGLIGLFTFVSFILLAFSKVYVRGRELAQSDPDLALLGASLAAAIAGTILMIANSSFHQGYSEMFYVLAGLATGYAGLRATPIRYDVSALSHQSMSQG